MSSKAGRSLQPSIAMQRVPAMGMTGTWIWKAVAIVLLLFAILVPRAVALDRLVTPDENRWLARSANFYYALAHGDFADTYQIEHPGVLTMWAGMFAFISQYPAYSDQAPGQFEWWQDDLGSFLQDHGYDPLELLVAGRFNMIVIIALVLMVAMWAAARLLDFWPAVTGFLFIALDPFHIALTRLLHVDGLPSILGLLSLLAFLNYLYRGGQKRDLILSGAAAGLAWLTKSPMLFLIPFVGLLLLLELLEKWIRQRRLERKDLWQTVSALALWGGMGLAVFVLLWPSMWVDPIFTLRRMLGGTLSYAGQGHDSQLFFNGLVFEGDPGAHFYPITFLWRTTPVALSGLTLAVLGLALPKLKLLPSEQRRPVGMLLLFAILFTLFMTLGAKKFDRYILPIYPPLDLVAGVGWVAAVAWVRRYSQRWSQITVPALLLAVLAWQAAGTFSSYPYYFSHYNPILGGTARAPGVMMIGWGEGLDLAAQFLNNQPGATGRQVATGVWSTTFSYYYNGPVISSRFEPGTNAEEDWIKSDYYVLYINEKQRLKISNDLADYLARLKPAHVVRIHGIDYVYIYDIRDLPPPDFLKSPTANESGE